MDRDYLFRVNYPSGGPAKSLELAKPYEDSYTAWAKNYEAQQREFWRTRERQVWLVELELERREMARRAAEHQLRLMAVRNSRVATGTAIGTLTLKKTKRKRDRRAPSRRSR